MNTPLRLPAGSLRTRMVLLILAATVPLLALGAVFAWENFHFSYGQSLQRALLRRQAVAARLDAAVDGTGQLLAALARLPAVQQGGPACDASLHDVLMLQPVRYASLSVVAPDGAMRCRAAAPATPAEDRPVVTGWIVAARTVQVGPIVGALAPGGAQGPSIPVILPLRRQGKLTGAIVASLSATALLAGEAATQGPVATWLIAADGSALPLGSARPGQLPPPRVLHRLSTGMPTLLGADAVDGHSYAYASTLVSGALHLVVGERLTAEEATARQTLFRRFAELGFLLLLGLVGVAIGTGLLVGAPLRRLADAVRRWRGGGGYAPGDATRMPSELRELSLSFSRAIAALRDREDALKSALRQQELLMKEIHHRVKNNLQIVASLLNLQASRVHQPEARAEFAAARDRVHALATLHRHLYTQGELHTLNMRSFLTELCGQLFQAMGGRDGDRIALEIDAPELTLSSDQAVPIALIVTEAVGNALKYAFPRGRRGRIGIHLTVAGNAARLIIEDDGVGMPAGQVETETGTRDGIGLQLIRGFVRQLGATLSIEQDGGTRYIVDMPLGRERQTAEPTPPESGVP